MVDLGNRGRVTKASVGIASVKPAIDADARLGCAP